MEQSSYINKSSTEGKELSQGETGSCPGCDSHDLMKACRAMIAIPNAGLQGTFLKLLEMERCYLFDD